MKLQKIGFVCFGVQDMKRSREFYEGVLGLKVTETLNEGWIEFDIGNTTLCLTSSHFEQSKFGFASSGIAFEVEDDAEVDAWVEKMKAAGIEVLMGPFDSPTCRGAIAVDPDGNIISFHKLAQK